MEPMLGVQRRRSRLRLGTAVAIALVIFGAGPSTGDVVVPLGDAAAALTEWQPCAALGRLAGAGRGTGGPPHELADMDPPAWIGPAEFASFGAKGVAVRCPSELEPLMRKADGLWEAGIRRWLVPRRRLNPLIRELQRVTDPLFRWARIDLDGAGQGGTASES